MLLWQCVGVCQSSRLPCDTQADWSDCGPDGPWHGWLDQVEHYQTTHSGRHRLGGISVLGSRGSTGTMEALQSNKLIGGRETDTPVLYRVTETLRGARQRGSEEEERSLGCTDWKEKWRGWRLLMGACIAKLRLPPTPQQHEQHYERHVACHLFRILQQQPVHMILFSITVLIHKWQITAQHENGHYCFLLNSKGKNRHCQ